MRNYNLEEMKEIKEKFNAWLVVRDTCAEDYNCVVTSSYLIFTENKVLVLGSYGDNKFEELKENDLFLYYSSIKNAYERLDVERQLKLKKYLDLSRKQLEVFNSNYNK